MIDEPILIVNSFLDADRCRKTISDIETAKNNIGEHIESGDGYYYHFSPPTELKELTLEQIIPIAESHLKKPIKVFDDYVRQYHRGALISEHLDSGKGYPCMEIDICGSALLYLNEEYSGGELYFRMLDRTIIPKTGDLLIFGPEDNLMHETKELLSGVKWTYVLFFEVD